MNDVENIRRRSTGFALFLDLSQEAGNDGFLAEWDKNHGGCRSILVNGEGSTLLLAALGGALEAGLAQELNDAAGEACELFLSMGADRQAGFQAAFGLIASEYGEKYWSRPETDPFHGINRALTAQLREDAGKP